MTRAPRSTQRAAQQADQAADQLLDWLRQQRGGIFNESLDAAQHNALLVADQPTVGELATALAESILDDDKRTKASPTESVAIEVGVFGLHDVGNLSRDGSSLRRSTDAIEVVEALAHAGADASRRPASFGNAAAGLEEMTSPLQEHSGDDEGLKDRSSSRYRNGGVGSALRLSQPDWLHHRLNVTGPAAALTGFQTAARGAGTIPWPLDHDRMEEDLFHLLVAPPAPQRRRLSLAGARVLARQLSEAAELRHAAAVARVGHSRACPFDLHALVPVPPDILPLGPDHPDSLAWLQAHWGTTEALRHVVLEPALPQRQTPPPGSARLRLSFWSADWTPWQALATVAARWPALRFAVVPTYEPL